MEMPKYTCHKEVSALKIKRVHVDEDGQGVVLIFYDSSNYPPLGRTRSQLQGKPTPQDGMYYVVYEDGYFSFSPAEVFESGYSLKSTQNDAVKQTPLDKLKSIGLEAVRMAFDGEVTTQDVRQMIADMDRALFLVEYPGAANQAI